MKRKKLFLSFFISLFALIMFEFYFYLNFEIFEARPKTISIICDGTDSDTFENLKLGAENAAGSQAEITLVTLTESTIENQIDAINKQILEKNDAIIICPIEDKTVADYITSIKSDSDFIFIEGCSNANSITCVNNDEYSLGADFAAFILENQDIKDINILIREGEDVRYQERIKGLSDYFEINGINYKLSMAKESNRIAFYKSAFNYGRYDAIVVFNDEVLEFAATEKKANDEKTLIYAVANSSKAVYYLDADAIEGLCFVDDFSMGYIAVDYYLKNTKTIKNDNCFYHCVSRENMYESDNEKILFPFVK